MKNCQQQNQNSTNIKSSTPTMSERYYIYSKNGAGVFKYRTSTGEWSENFINAMLWGNKAFTEKKAVQLRKDYLRYAIQRGTPIPQEEIEVIMSGIVEVVCLGEPYEA